VSLFARHRPIHYSDQLCRTRLAWSRLGCVASLSPDALSVNIRHLLFSGSERKWNLSKEHSIDLSANGDSQHPILQLEWSHLGTDLALVDAVGRVTIINASSMALNETAVVRPATLDREDELSQILTLYWLNIDRQVGGGQLLLASTKCPILTDCTVCDPHACVKRPGQMDVHGGHAQTSGAFMAARSPCHYEKRGNCSSLSTT
jgi:hypothetical protein